jgi:Tol biopolymer transport system component/predicted Ser/Thr protein kinase
MIGETILHYKILEKLGEGGMGEVYKAQDTKLDRFVALKFLSSQLTATEDEKARFIQEAKSASAMNHPNVCTIHDIQEHNEQLFIVMEFVDGKTLRDKKDALSTKQILEIGIQVSEGLAAAHEKGIVHRDIKPENIMIRKDGIAQIMDFGLAKLYKGAVSRLTKAGTTMGTLGYMSPEQVQGLDVDHRTDIFSLGVVLYELLAGESPFKGVHETAIMYEIVNVDPPPPSTIKSEIDPELDAVILECLEKDKDERCQSAKELAKDLRKIKKSTGHRKSRTYNVDSAAIKTKTGQPQISKSSGSFSIEVLNRKFDLTKIFRLKYLPWIISIVLLGLVIYLWSGRRTYPTNTFEKFEQITEQSGQELYPDISPDGNYIIYTKSVGEFQHIFLQRIGGGNAIDLTKDTKVDNYQPSFSPNGELIAFRSERDGGGIFLMGSTGESVRRLTDFGYNPAWSPDGKKVLFATESVEHPYSRGTTSQLWTADVEGGETQKIYDGDAVQPRWSPNGKWIAYWGLPRGTGQRVIWIISASGGNPVMITKDNYINWSPTWSADGKYLYFSSSRGGSMNLWKVKINEGSGEILSGLEPVITPSLFCAMARISRDGKKIIYVSAETRANIYKVNFDPNGEKVTDLPVPVTQGSKQYHFPDISPDNKWIAVSSAGQQEDIYIMRTDGSGILKLTNDIFKDRNPQWSPDGKSLIFFSDRTGKYEIWKINTDGSNLRQLTNTNDVTSHPIWFPDGRMIASVYSVSKNVLLSPDSAEVNKFKYLPDLNEDGMLFQVYSISPDGNFIAGNRRELISGNYVGIIVYSMTKQNYTKLSDSGLGPNWFTDNKRILYEDNSRFYVMNRSTGSRHPVYNSPQILPSWEFYACSPDNKSIYFIKEEKESDIWMGYLH